MKYEAIIIQPLGKSCFPVLISFVHKLKPLSVDKETLDMVNQKPYNINNSLNPQYIQNIKI